MIDRRRTPRYVLDTPLRAEAMPMEDVTIERYSTDRIVVVSPSSHRVADELMLHVTTSAGLASRRATVLSSTPVSLTGVLCYRIELEVTDGADRRADRAAGADAADVREGVRDGSR